MPNVTPEATQWLTRLLDDATSRISGHVLRMKVHGERELAFTLGPVRRDDLLFHSGARVILAVAPQLAALTSGLTIVRDRSERGAGVVLV
jgi:hypothetical protein